MDEIRSKIKKSFLEIFQTIIADEFDFNKERAEFENWDSLTHMQLISQIESDFGINFEMDEIVDINKPEDLVALVAKKQHG